MTVAEAGRIFAYWEVNPPVHVMVQAIARMLGWKPASEASPAVADIVAMAPPGLSMAQGGDLGMPAPVLDIEALRTRNRERFARARATL